MLWALVNACAGWVLAALPAILAGTGLIAFIYPAVGPRTGDAASTFTVKPGGPAIPAPAFPGNDRTALLLIGIAFVLAGVASAQWLLRAYGGLARLDARADRAGRAGAAGRATWPRPGPTRIDARRGRDAPDRAGPARRRAGPAGGDGHDAGRGRAAARVQPGGGPGPAGRGARVVRPGAGRAARPGPRHPPAGAGRPRPGRRGARAGPGQCRCACRSPASCRAARPRRWSRPRTSRSASCWPTCPSTPAPGQAWIDMRHEGGMLRVGVIDDGRGGADPGPRHRPARDRAPARGLRRRAGPVQPAGRPDRGEHGDPVRVVIAEDLFLLRDGLTRLLQAHGLRGRRRGRQRRRPARRA